MKIDLTKTYKNFDDGKVKTCRMYDVKLTEVIPFEDISSEILSEWEEEVEHCYWLYSKSTDFFLKGCLDLLGGDFEDVYYVRTLCGGWFCLGEWAGRLDLDGSLEAQLYKDMEKWRVKC